mmetsp:Transcript_60883/g.109638  ORF Transcript_60883/g.109638 Transcript_60883/m.109638 type:complete len:131 (+) Transcript_60883:103-495(+)
MSSALAPGQLHYRHFAVMVALPTMNMKKLAMIKVLKNAMKKVMKKKVMKKHSIDRARLPGRLFCILRLHHGQAVEEQGRQGCFHGVMHCDQEALLHDHGFLGGKEDLCNPFKARSSTRRSSPFKVPELDE